jgi:predicted  nucleic acid-binding Zn-ribbon protein
MENEAHVATIGLLKLQNSSYQETISTMMRHHQSQTDEMTKAHAAALKAVQDRYADSEKKFLDSTKDMSVELERCKREIADLKGRQGHAERSAPSTSQHEELDTLRAEVAKLQEKLREAQLEKMTVVERLKSTEQLKSLQEQDIKRVKMSTANLQKMIQAAVLLIIKFGYLRWFFLNGLFTDDCGANANGSRR